MLRRMHMSRFRIPWWAPVLPWGAVAAFAWLGASITEDFRLIATAGLLTALMLASIGRQVQRHRRHHHRMDRRVGFMADVLRWTFERGGDTAPALLEDERELGPGVVRLRPRGAPRHSRARSRRGNA